jgi:hypothetical protein
MLMYGRAAGQKQKQHELLKLPSTVEMTPQPSCYLTQTTSTRDGHYNLHYAPHSTASLHNTSITSLTNTNTKALLTTDMAPRNRNIHFNHRRHIATEIEIEFMYIPQIVWAKPNGATEVQSNTKLTSYKIMLTA